MSSSPSIIVKAPRGSSNVVVAEKRRSENDVAPRLEDAATPTGMA
jgi:hypothetical protein